MISRRDINDYYQALLREEINLTMETEKSYIFYAYAASILFSLSQLLRVKDTKNSISYNLLPT